MLSPSNAEVGTQMLLDFFSYFDFWHEWNCSCCISLYIQSTLKTELYAHMSILLSRVWNVACNF